MIGMLTKTKGHRQFFMAEFWMVGRQIRRKIPLIVTRAPANRTLEQPFPHPIFRAAAQPADLAEQRGNMRNLPQPTGQRSTAQ